MRTSRLTAALVVALVTVAIPAAAQAATKTVLMGNPHSSDAAFSKLDADVNDFFPHGTTLHVGDSVRFKPVAFHDVDLIAKGGRPLLAFAPTGQKISDVNDEAGQPFWFNGRDHVFFNTELFKLNFGKKFKFDGSKELVSGLPLVANPKPFTVKFTKKGSFRFFCNIHPDMAGRVIVRGRKARVKSVKDDARVIKRQVKTALRIARGLADNLPATGDTIAVGSAGPHGVEYFGFVPNNLTVDRGTTVTFRITDPSYSGHTATIGPGDPQDKGSYLGKLASSLVSFGPFDPRAVYPSEPRGTVATLTPTYHGNGFWNTGIIDSSDSTHTIRDTYRVTFGEAGTYNVFCLIHASMHATVTVR
jgi:plastocyanin